MKWYVRIIHLHPSNPKSWVSMARTKSCSTNFKKYMVSMCNVPGSMSPIQYDSRMGWWLDTIYYDNMLNCKEHIASDRLL